jgi:hypothetical protein
MFHHEEGPLRLEDTNDLTQCSVLHFSLEFIESMRACDGVETAGGERKVPYVGLHQMNGGKASGLSLAHFQHAMGKIDPYHELVVTNLGLQVWEKSSRSGADIKNRATVCGGHHTSQERSGLTLHVAGMQGDETVVEP